MTAARPVVERMVDDHGLVLWAIDFQREAGRETLSVSCDKVGGVSSGELSELARDISRELDHLDAVPGDGRYVLDVASPGAERPIHTLEQFAVCVGRRVRARVADADVVATIEAVEDGSVRLEGDDGPRIVSVDEISEARLIVEGIG